MYAHGLTLNCTRPSLIPFIFLQFLYVVGKNRFNLGMKIDVLVPLLHSLKLFVHLSPLLSLESLRTLKISNRLVYLSTIYKSLDLIDESVITEVLALSFDALEVSLIPCEVASHVRLFESLAHLTRDVICTGISLDNKLVTNQRSGLVNSLVLSLSQRNRSEHNVLGDDSESAKPSSLDAARIIDLLLDSFRGDGKASGLFEHRSVAAFNLGEILNVMLTTNSMLPHEHSNRSTLLMEKTKAVVEVMVKVAQVLQQNDHRTMETRAASLEDHKCICRLAESFIQQLGTEDATSPNVTTAMLFVVASISLISCHPSLDFDSWTADIFGPNEEIATLFHFNISEKYANKAYIILDALSDGSEWHCVSSAFRSALDLYRFQLSYLRQNERKLYQFDLKGLQVTFENIRVAATPTHVLSALSKRCLIRVLSRLCGLYSLKGEDLRAVQVAKWTIDVLEDKNDDLHSWFETTLLSLLATDSVVFPGLLDVNATVASHPTAFEDKACRLRLLARGTTDFLQLDNIQCSLGLLLEGFNNCVPDCDGRVSFYLQQWSRTTILLGLSECAERRAEMETAHDLLKKCFVQCRNIASSLRRRRYPLVEAEHSFWIAVAVASLLVRCVKRQVECLQKMALLYSRLGTHRKAMDYALLALKMLSPESVMLNTKSEFVDMIQFARIHPSQSCQEMRSRRLLLRLKSQASPLNLVVRMFGVEADGLVLSSALLNRSDQLTANRELEEISDSYESKSTSAFGGLSL